MTPTLVLVVIIFGLVLLFLWAKLVQMRRAEFIREFSLPPGLYDKLREKHPDLSLKDCQLVGHALRQFFLAYLKSGKQYISMPSQVVDDLWHEFILYTRNYAHFCRRAFGGFLHHTPAVMMSTKGQGRNDGLARCWWQACREEDINPRLPTRLPLLFAIDRKLTIDGGFFYLLDCTNEVELAKVSSLGPIHCATTLATMFPKRDKSGSGCGSGCSSSSCTGGSHGCSGSGCSGGCGGGD